MASLEAAARRHVNYLGRCSGHDRKGTPGIRHEYSVCSLSDYLTFDNSMIKCLVSA